MAEERSVWREYLEALIIAAIFLLFTNTFVIQTFYIPSGSMEETLLVGDHLFVNRFIYGSTATGAEDQALPFREVRRGDIVVFRSPEDPKLDLVKRCIGVGGDTLEMIDQRLFVNGKPVDDSSYVVHKDRDRDPGTIFGDPNMGKRDNFGPIKVPPGEYFCMGDNRDNSYDSRFWGTVPAHLVKGRVLFIYWSYGGRTSTGFESTGTKLRNLLDTALGFFTKTRWDRTFRLIR